MLQDTVFKCLMKCLFQCISREIPAIVSQKGTSWCDLSLVMFSTKNKPRALITKHNLLTTLSACPLTNRGSYFYLEKNIFLTNNIFLVICINSIIIYHCLSYTGKHWSRCQLSLGTLGPGYTTRTHIDI